MNAIRNCLKTLLVAAIAVLGIAYAQTLPPQWRKINNDPANNYEATLSADARFEGQYGALVRRVTPNRGQSEFGGLIQVARAAPWRGQRVLMRAWIKTLQADAGGMWLRIDAANTSLAMDNMGNRTIKGTTGWSQYEIVLDVPQEAEYLVYGVLLLGGGVLDIDNVEFMAAPPGAKTTLLYNDGAVKLKHGQTYTPPRIVLDAPSNLDFEQPPAP
jgi:hypothetical protein